MPAFLVESDSESEGNSGKEDVDENIDVDISILMIGKKIGLSFDELNELRVKDVVKCVKAFTGKGSKKNTRRNATQKDIDSFYAR